MHFCSKMNRGFTLIEMLVSLAVFSIVVTMSMSAIVAVLDANQKSQTLRSAMDNLNISLESMSRAIRFGDSYHCTGTGTLASPKDCTAGDSTLIFRGSDGVGTVYYLSNGQIMRQPLGLFTYVPMTSPDITIENLKFYVVGSNPYCSGGGCPACGVAPDPDLCQPRVSIVIKGYVGRKATTKTTFSLQTTVSQRKLDFQ